jgi:hypothetical protein
MENSFMDALELLAFLGILPPLNRAMLKAAKPLRQARIDRILRVLPFIVDYHETLNPIAGELDIWLDGYRLGLVPCSFFVKYSHSAIECFEVLQQGYSVWATNRLIVMCWLVDQALLSRSEIPCLTQYLLDIGMDFLAGQRWDPTLAKRPPSNPFFYMICNSVFPLGYDQAVITPSHCILTVVRLRMSESVVWKACQSVLCYYSLHSNEKCYEPEDLRLLTLVFGYVDLSKRLHPTGSLTHATILMRNIVGHLSFSREQIELLITWYKSELDDGKLDEIRTSELNKCLQDLREQTTS